jgi:nucleotide-binding universal stress UspA family protein
MRILLGLDEQPYSEFAVKQTARLATHTWADITLLASVRARPKSASGFKGFPIHPSYPGTPFSARFEMLRRYWKTFLDHCPPDAPYFEESIQPYLVEVREQVFEEVKLLRPQKKELRLRLSLTPPAEGIVSEAQEEGHDLVVIGCGKGEGCVWRQPKDVPQRVVNESISSVMVVKEDREIHTLLCCLDQGNVSQESLEMINQLATVHGASLNIIGLTRERAIRYEVDQQLWGMQDYYNSRGIETSVQLKELSELDRFLEREEKPDLLALWVGKKSLLSRFFPKDWPGTIVRNSPCSVIILR